LGMYTQPGMILCFWMGLILLLLPNRACDRPYNRASNKYVHIYIYIYIHTHTTTHIHVIG